MRCSIRLSYGPALTLIVLFACPPSILIASAPMQPSVRSAYSPQHRHFHDAHATEPSSRLAGALEISPPRAGVGRSRSCTRSDDRRTHPAPLNNPAPALPSVAAVLLHHRRAQ